MPEVERRRSLSARLALLLALLFAGGMAAVAFAALSYGRAAADRSYDRLLVGAANAIAAATVVRDGKPEVDVPVTAFELLALAPDDRIVYAVRGPSGELLTGYDALSPTASGKPLYDGRWTGEPVRFAVATRDFAERAFSGRVQVIVGQTTRARGKLAGEITQGALVLVATIGLVVSALAFLAVRAAFRPLSRIEARLASRAPRDLTPIDLAVPREVGGLVDTLNHFMAQVDRQLATMRTLIADASHQLRTPIAALRAQAELALEEPDGERQREIVGLIHRRSVNLSRLTDQLLSRAMIIHRADAVPLTPIDLRHIASQAVEDSDLVLPDNDAPIGLDLSEDPVMVEGDALSLAEACKNLIANALNHGVRPITVGVRAEPGQAILFVRDRGPGLPESAWPSAGNRFSRRSGVSSTSAGLGLAIVSAVARAHGGRLRFARPEDGGFEVAVALPVHPEEAS